jgi:aldehyde dehydrogenase (NAD+)
MTASTFPIRFPTDRLLVGGEWRAAAAGATIALEDPSDGSELARIGRGGAADIDAAVGRGARRARRWRGRRWGGSARSSAAASSPRSAGKVLDNVELLAELEVHDVGKPLKQARADAVALARYCEFYAGACDKVHGQTLPFANGYTALTLREPHGVTGHIVPWNYPMQIVGRSVGAALAMGNACVLKPAEEACLTVLAFARICAEAGCRRARSTSSPASARRPARRSRRIRASITSRSPGRSRPARWCRSRRRGTRCR